LRRVRDLLSYGQWIWVERVIVTLSEQSLTGLIGRLLDSNSVGLYTKACQFVLAPLQLLSASLKEVLFPTYSAMQHQAGGTAAIERYNRTLIAAVLVVAVFYGGVICFLAEDLVGALLGESWLGMVPLIHSLTPVILLQGPVLVLGPSLFNGIGKPQLTAQIRLIHCVLLLTLTFFGIRHFGTVGVVYALGMALVADWVAWAFHLVRLRMLTFAGLIGLFAPPVAVLAVGAWGVTPLVKAIPFAGNATPALTTLGHGVLVLGYYGVACTALTFLGPFAEVRVQVLALVRRLVVKGLSR